MSRDDPWAVRAGFVVGVIVGFVAALILTALSGCVPDDEAARNRAACAHVRPGQVYVDNGVVRKVGNVIDLYGYAFVSTQGFSGYDEVPCWKIPKENVE